MSQGIVKGVEASSFYKDLPQLKVGVSVFVALWSGGVTLGSAATNGLVRRIEGPVLLRLQCLCAILALAVMGGTSHYGVYLGAR